MKFVLIVIGGVFFIFRIMPHEKKFVDWVLLWQIIIRECITIKNTKGFIALLFPWWYWNLILKFALGVHLELWRSGISSRGDKIGLKSAECLFLKLSIDVFILWLEHLYSLGSQKVVWINILINFYPILQWHLSLANVLIKIKQAEGCDPVNYCDKKL